MRTMLALAVVLLSPITSFGQNAPVMYGGKPLLQVGPKATAAKPAKSSSSGKTQSVAVRLQECLDIDDGTKNRLNCYDEIFPPKPNPKAAEAKGVADCRFKPEEDDRLACFNDFAERIPKLPRS